MPSDLNSRSETVVVPLYEERLTVDVRGYDTEQVRVRTHVTEREELVSADLVEELVEVERVQIGKEIDTAPEIRRDGDMIVVPVIKEILVRRLVLVEEIRLHKVRHQRRVEEPVVLRSMDATVEREPLHKGDES